MRVAGKLASEVLDYITPFVKPGITTEELDKLCHDYMVDVQHVIPAPLDYAPPGYSPYPKSICTSVNHQVCHGVPGQKKLKSGDIVNIDVTVIKDQYHGDTSRMFYVGEPGIQARRLCEVTARDDQQIPVEQDHQRVAGIAQLVEHGQFGIEPRSAELVEIQAGDGGGSGLDG